MLLYIQDTIMKQFRKYYLNVYSVAGLSPSAKYSTALPLKGISAIYYFWSRRKILKTFLTAYEQRRIINLIGVYEKIGHSSRRLYTPYTFFHLASLLDLTKENPSSYTYEEMLLQTSLAIYIY